VQIRTGAARDRGCQNKDQHEGFWKVVFVLHGGCNITFAEPPWLGVSLPCAPNKRERSDSSRTAQI
jgi:hypothetical protein